MTVHEYDMGQSIDTCDSPCTMYMWDIQSMDMTWDSPWICGTYSPLIQRGTNHGYDVGQAIV